MFASVQQHGSDHADLTAANLKAALGSLNDSGPLPEIFDESPSDTTPQQPSMVGTNVYVSNLPSAMNSSKFRHLFGVFGTIIGARLVKRRKGDAPVGFVQFTTPEMATNAIKTMDGKNIDGSMLSVRLANRDKDKGINNKPSSNLYVANLPQKVTELDLRMIFSRYGDIHSLRVLKYPNTGVSKGTALVRFVSLDDAIRAKESLHCLPLHGQDLPLEVKYAETKEEKLSRRDNRSNNPAQPKVTSEAAPTSPFAFGQHKESMAHVAEVIERYRQQWNLPEDTSEQLNPDDLTEDLLAVCMDEPELPGSPLSGREDEAGLQALDDFIQNMLTARAEDARNNNKGESETRSSNIGSSVGNDGSSGSSHSSPPEFSALDGPQSPESRTSDIFSSLSAALVPSATTQESTVGTSGSTVLRVENLRQDVERITLYEMFTPLGAIIKLDSTLEPNGSMTAIVTFRNAEEASTAQSTLNGSVFQGRNLDAKLQ